LSRGIAWILFLAVQVDFWDIIYGKNDFADKSKILLDTRSKHNFVGNLKIMSSTAKNLDILATSLSVLHNYFDNLTKLLFRSVSS